MHRRSRKRVGAADDKTMMYVVLGIGAVAVIYFMNRPRVINTPGGTYVQSGNALTALPSNATAQDINAAASGLNQIANTLANQGVIGS